jgi:hypothetical protein
VAGTFARHDVFLTRTDSSGAPTLRLDNAIITGFTAPAVTRASTAPAFLSVEITPEILRRVAATRS